MPKIPTPEMRPEPYENRPRGLMTPSHLPTQIREDPFYPLAFQKTRLSIKPSAGKELEAVGSKADRQRIVAKIQALAVDARPRGSEKLAGYDDRYRLRQGNYRIVYLVDDDASVVTIYKIGHRKDVYR